MPSVDLNLSCRSCACTESCGKCKPAVACRLYAVSTYLVSDFVCEQVCSPRRRSHNVTRQRSQVSFHRWTRCANKVVTEVLVNPFDLHFGLLVCLGFRRRSTARTLLRPGRISGLRPAPNGRKLRLRLWSSSIKSCTQRVLEACRDRHHAQWCLFLLQVVNVDYCNDAEPHNLAEHAGSATG